MNILRIFEPQIEKHYAYKKKKTHVSKKFPTIQLIRVEVVVKQHLTEGPEGTVLTINKQFF